MTNKKKFKLGTVFALGLTIILVLLTIAFSITSMDSVTRLGDYAISVFRKNTRRNAFMFFRETTYRATAEYSTYFESVADFTAIMAKQIQKQLLEAGQNFESTTNKVKLTIYDRSNFYTDRALKDFTAIYWGGENEKIQKVDEEMTSILTLDPMFKTNMARNKGYFVNIWVHGIIGYSLIYPHNDFYMKYKNRTVFQKNFSAMFYDSEGKKNWKEMYQTWSPPYIDIITGKPVVSVFTPVFDLSNKVIAIVGLDLDLENLNSFMLSSQMLRGLEGRGYKEIDKDEQKLEGFIFIVDRNGDLIALDEEDYELLSLQKKAVNLSSYYKIKRVNLGKSKDVQIKKLAEEMRVKKNGLKMLNLNGGNYIFTYNRIRSVDWTMVFVAHEETLMDSAIQTRTEMKRTEKEMQTRFAIIILMFLVLSILITILFFKHFFLLPIKKIRNKIRKMGDGNFDLQLEEDGAAEIVELSSAFNLLGRELTCYTENLKKESAARQAVETEIEIAAKMQKTILPKISHDFKNEKFQLYANLKPAKNISGDFYDFFFLDDKRLALVIADVAGKGLSAAFFMGMGKVLIKNISLKYKDDPARILKLVNKALCMDNPTGMFVTVFLAFYDIETGDLVYSNGGHNSTVLFSDKGRYKTFGIMNKPALGFYDAAVYENKKNKIKIGETLLMYTDGVIESISPDEVEYGEERLRNIILENREERIDELCDIIINDVKSYEKGNQYDDITLLALKRLN